MICLTEGKAQYAVPMPLNNALLRLGVNMAFGTHVCRLGVNLQFTYLFNAFQSNSELRAYYNFKNLGPKGGHPELVLSQGLIAGFGPVNDYPNPFVCSVSNQTNLRYAVAYAYNAYFSARKTSQQTGCIALYAGSFGLLTENDILARPSLDRFRTAAFLLQYQHKDLFQAGLNCTMWTGQFKRKKESTDPHFYHGCYMDTVRSVYSSLSNGVLSAQIKFQPLYYNTLQLNAGIDAEQVRNVMQNKLIHDMPFIPRKWSKARNCHIPMLDQNGNAFVYEPSQQVRKAKLFLNAYSNANVFY